MEKLQNLGKAQGILEEENKQSPREEVIAQTPTNICQAILQKTSSILRKSKVVGRGEQPLKWKQNFWEERLQRKVCSTLGRQ